MNIKAIRNWKIDSSAIVFWFFVFGFFFVALGVGGGGW